MNDRDALLVMTARFEREKAYAAKLRDDVEERDRLVVVLSNDARRVEEERDKARAQVEDQFRKTVAAEEREKELRIQTAEAAAEWKRKIAALERHNAILTENAQRLADRLKARTGATKRRKR